MKQSMYVGILLLSACTSPGNNGTEQIEAKTRKIATDVFAAFNAHDWHKMESLYSDSVVLEDPSYPKGKKGKAGMTDFYKSVPDIHDEVTRIFVEGNVAVVEFVSTGTIDGQKFSIPICTVLTVADALVVQDNTYYDATN
jgi:ketosteroid isomerase-like protein